MRKVINEKLSRLNICCLIFFVWWKCFLLLSTVSDVHRQQSQLLSHENNIQASSKCLVNYVPTFFFSFFIINYYKMGKWKPRIKKNLRYWHRSFLQSCSCWVLGRSRRDSLWTKCRGSKKWQVGDILFGRVQWTQMLSLRRCMAASDTCRGCLEAHGHWSEQLFSEFPLPH